MSTLTGLDKPVIAFDWDGTLTSLGEVPVGADAGATIDISPIRACLASGCAVAVMTCNVVDYVAQVLRSHGVDAIADLHMGIKVWDGGPDGKTVLVTGRKVLADIYPDDHGLRWSYGDDPRLILAKVITPYKPEGDGCVPAVPGYNAHHRTAEYDIYVKTHLAFIAGEATEKERNAALARAQESAAKW